jgi:hypothetical protein
LYNSPESKSHQKPVFVEQSKRPGLPDLPGGGKSGQKAQQNTAIPYLSAIPLSGLEYDWMAIPRALPWAIL